ncbi:hypothetical protein FZC76_14855 [Sutcliffiella horikoshii]|uniref:Uncharacterized protein n=1 Tax=Sutcliffiella horikoshii TaxID=79883 RepID=A0A5D4SWZ7_9BACI|nr:hypothetical protein [Sutcliffiella horikoshii]TYS67835.1 hypothetical protein FZC76_14855 [Sutcliffiella horikoshii]
MKAPVEIIIQLGIPGNKSDNRNNNGVISTKVNPMKNDFFSGTVLIFSNIFSPFPLSLAALF